WTQVGPALPGFAADDFRLKEDTASFLRVLGGDGSAGSPWQISDVFGLQGMESLGLLDEHFLLANDIDASGTANWHAGMGFDRIGKSLSPLAVFSGSLDGQGKVITDLTINRFASIVGLFGGTSS